MTAQRLDTLRHAGQGFDLISGGAFGPADWDIYPDGDSSDCWRGYVCHYLIEGDTLFLDELELCQPSSELIGLDEQGEIIATPARWPSINGVAPERVGGGLMPWRYPALALPGPGASPWFYRYVIAGPNPARRQPLPDRCGGFSAGGGLPYGSAFAAGAGSVVQ